jgi:fibro-slime domain-containing protein
MHRSRFLLLVFFAAFLFGGRSVAQEEGTVAVFGTTVVNPSGLRGEVFLIPRNIQTIPKFEKLKSLGYIYTDSLNIPNRDFNEGFPGITDRFEWFAIDYTGRFYVQNPGIYRFSLTSDDGSMLYIDDKLVIDNGGVHPARTLDGGVDLSGGIHKIRVSYFQGPRFQIALVLKVTNPGKDSYRVFSTNEFKPPANPEDWKYGSPNDLPTAPDPSAGKKKKAK